MSGDECETVNVRLKVCEKDPPAVGERLWTFVTALLLPLSIAGGGWAVQSAISDAQDRANEAARAAESQRNDDAQAAEEQRSRDAQAAEDRRRSASLDVEFVRIAVGVLANPAADPQLSAWAMTTLTTYSPVPFDADLATALRQGTINLPEVAIARVEATSSVVRRPIAADECAEGSARTLNPRSIHAERCTESVGSGASVRIVRQGEGYTHWRLSNPTTECVCRN